MVKLKTWLLMLSILGSTYLGNAAYYLTQQNRNLTFLVKEKNNLLDYEKQLRELDRMEFRINMEEFFTTAELPNGYDEQTYMAVQKDYENILNGIIESEDEIKRLSFLVEFDDKKVWNPFAKP